MHDLVNGVVCYLPFANVRVIYVYEYNKRHNRKGLSAGMHSFLSVCLRAFCAYLTLLRMIIFMTLCLPMNALHTDTIQLFSSMCTNDQVKFAFV